MVKIIKPVALILSLTFCFLISISFVFSEGPVPPAVQPDIPKVFINLSIPGTYMINKQYCFYEKYTVSQRTMEGYTIYEERTGKFVVKLESIDVLENKELKVNFIWMGGWGRYRIPPDRELVTAYLTDDTGAKLKCIKAEGVAYSGAWFFWGPKNGAYYFAPLNDKCKYITFNKETATTTYRLGPIEVIH